MKRSLLIVSLAVSGVTFGLTKKTSISLASTIGAPAAATASPEAPRGPKSSLIPNMRELLPSESAEKAPQAARDTQTSASEISKEPEPSPIGVKQLDANTCQNAKGILFRSEDPGYAACHTAYLKQQEDSREGSSEVEASKSNPQ